MGAQDILGMAGDGGNLLPERTRRDVADLNALYLDRALDPRLGQDEWFTLPGEAASRFAQAGRAARDLAACCPTALFQLVLPPATEWHRLGSGVTDGCTQPAADSDLLDLRRAFGLASLGLARRLAEATPIAVRLVFGLAREAERLLVDLTLSDAFHVAAWPGLVRPRWPAHPAYWRALAGAAAEESTTVLRWLHATALCLDEGAAMQMAESGVRGRRARHLQRRARPGPSEVPC